MLYISYGSNMNLEQMKYRCPNSKVIGNGKIYGWNLIFNIHADVLEVPDKSKYVPVVVWDIAEEDWMMLDRYEGYPSYYIKRDIKVILDDGREVTAVVYVMAENRRGIALPSKEYFNVILRGYKENNIDTKYLYDTLEYSAYHETFHNQYNAWGN